MQPIRNQVRKEDLKIDVGPCGDRLLWIAPFRDKHTLRVSLFIAQINILPLFGGNGVTPDVIVSVLPVKVSVITFLRPTAL